MSNIYHVIMAKRTSPLTMYFEARPYEIYLTKKEAERRLKYLMERRTTNDYWIDKAPLKGFIDM